MEDFREIHEALVAGMDVFKFTLVEDVASFPKVRNLAITDRQILLKPGKQWRFGFAVNDTLDFAEPPSDGESGQLFSKDFGGLLPHDHIDIANLFFRNRYKPMLVQYTDRGGVSRLIGTPEQPVRVVFDFKNSGAPGGTKGWQFNFVGLHTHPSYYLNISTDPYFFINEFGQLFYDGGLQETFALDDGELEVTGPFESQYSLQNVLLKKTR